MTRILSVVAVMVSFCMLVSAQQATTFPSGIAFNGGVFSSKKINEAIASKTADRQKGQTNDEAVIRHFRIEVFERNPLSTRELVTFFVFVESRFHTAIGKGPKMRLTRVDAEYVILDSDGKSTEKLSRKVSVVERYDKKKKAFYWTKSFSSGRGVWKFHNALPKFAQDNLSVTSGFLDKNPGTPVINYEKTPNDVGKALFGLCLDLLPGVAKKPLGKVVEKALKKLTKVSLDMALTEKKARWGAASEIENEKAIKSRKIFLKAGKHMWTKR